MCVLVHNNQKNRQKKKGNKNYSTKGKSSNKGISTTFLGLKKHAKCYVKGRNL